MKTKRQDVVNGDGRNRVVETEPERVDFAQIESQITRRLADFPPSADFSLADLGRLTGEAQANLLYLEKKFGLLSPVTEQRERRQVRRYTLSDLHKALFVTALKKAGKSAAESVAMWDAREGQLYSAPFARDSAVAPVLHSVIDHVDRAKAQVLARLLQIVMEALCGGEPVSNALIVVEQVTNEQGAQYAGYDEQLAGHITLRVRSQTAGPVASLLRQYPRIPFGWSTPDGGVFTSFRPKDIEILVAKLPALNLFCIEMPMEDGACSHLVTLGIDKGSENLRLLDVQTAFAEGLVHVTRQTFILMQIVLEVMWRVVFRLEDLVKSEPTTPYRSLRQPDMLSVLANLVVATRGKWDYCGIMTPMAKDSLVVSAASYEFPVELRGRALYPIGASLVGWVYRFGRPLVVNRVVPDDPRFAFQALEKPLAAAAFPAALGSDDPTRGVLYIGTRTRQLLPDQEPFDQKDQVLLGVVGRIAGEILARSEMTRKTVAAALRTAPHPELPVISVQALRNTLIELMRRGCESPEGEGVDRHIVLFAARIGGYANLRRSDPSVAHWVIQNTMRLVYQVLAESVEDSSEMTVQLTELDTEREGSFAALVAPASSPLRDLRQILRQRLEKESYLGMKRDTDPMVWSLPFAFRELQGMVKEKGIERTADELVSRVNGALKVLPFIRQGDSYLTNREFDKARTQYELAHHHDADNPYHLRHLAECLIGAKKYDEAIVVLEQAIGLEPGYPGTYRHLAEAYVGKKDFDAAVGRLEKAIGLGTQDPSLYRRLGEVFVLRSKPEDGIRAINMFREAMAKDNADGLTQARYLTYIARAYAHVHDYDQAISRYEQALALDPRNEMIEFEMWLTLKSRDELGAEPTIPQGEATNVVR